MSTSKTFAMRDLARLASVDVSTVSRALNHDPRVNAERASHIRQLAEQIGYRPRPLRSKRARSIGLLITASPAQTRAEPYLERIAWETQQLGQRRMHVNLECIGQGDSVKLPLIVQQNRVDGVLIAGSPPVELVQQIIELGVPAVAINDSVERLGISSVRSDPRNAIHQAILNLAARGHESFALLIKRLDYPTAHTKHKAYTETLLELGITPKSNWLVTDFSEDLRGGREGIRRLQELGQLPTAILCENDWIALGAFQELQRQQIQIPRDVSLIGHDDLWFCEKLEPSMSSIQRLESELVARAIDLLIDELEGRRSKPKDVLVEGVMVWRDSTGPAPQRQATR